MFKKEFYKFKDVYLLLVVLITSFLAYLAFSLKDMVQNFGALSVNLSFLFKKKFTFFHLDDMNLIFAFVIAVFVFFHERINGRLRLSLHFPHSSVRNIGFIIMCGLLFVFFVYFVEIMILNIILGTVYAEEIMHVLNYSLSLNYIFGFLLYIFCCGFIIEPVKKRAIVNFIVMLGSIYLYYEINPDIYVLDSFYANDLGFYYMGIVALYALSAAFIAFDNYKRGYIK